MKAALSPLCRAFHWCARIRHRCGYGIHSPFAFGFVTGVVYERGAYYAYPLIDALAASPAAVSLRRKDLRLLFRLANFQQPERCLLSGFAPDSPAARCLRAGSRRTLYTTHPSGADMVVAADWVDCGAELIALLRPGGLMVLADIHSTRQRRAAWHALCRHPQAVVNFDLRDFGFIFYRPDLQRQSYVINYF